MFWKQILFFLHTTIQLLWLVVNMCVTILLPSLQRGAWKHSPKHHSEKKQDWGGRLCQASRKFHNHIRCYRSQDYLPNCSHVMNQVCKREGFVWVYSSFGFVLITQCGVILRWLRETTCHVGLMLILRHFCECTWILENFSFYPGSGRFSLWLWRLYSFGGGLGEEMGWNQHMTFLSQEHEAC